MKNFFIFLSFISAAHFSFARQLKNDRQVTYASLFNRYTLDEHKNVFLVNENNYFDRGIPFARWGTYTEWNNYRELIYKLWEKNDLSMLKNDKELSWRIPKRIFFIWLNNGNLRNRLPTKYLMLMKEFKEKLPDWEHILVDDAYVAKFGLKNKRLYNFAKNFGEKSDIVRMELLERMGGVYIDVDCECKNHKWFKFFNQRYDFYVSMEPIGVPGNCLIASCPHHPLIKAWIDNLEAWIDKIEKNEYVQKELQGNMLTIMRTGPWYLLDVIYHHIGKYKYRDIVLPSVFVHGPPNSVCKYAMVHHLGDSNWVNH